ncbi:T9SS C-terminal target domain-containing protein [candidate division KSB1 bacterium]|nr:MAG: T9SS C-terminal target domain-containing protein [candidate division KSB1 bacterium]
MRTRCALVSLALVLSTLIVLPALSATRTVLTEGFTNWGCNPCAGWNPTERTVLNALGRDTVLNIKYHTLGPQTTDIFYHWNTAENDARIDYYAITGVPTGFVNGNTTITRTETGFRNQVRQRRAIAAPCTIELQACVNGSSVAVTGTITATDSALNNVRLFLALINDKITYTSPPGANGETEFDNVFRDMWPNTNGQTISIPLGGTYQIQASLNLSTLDPHGMSVIAFIQNYSTKWVHQSAWTPVRVPYDAVTECPDERQLWMELGDEMGYLIRMENIGCNPDQYTVSLVGDLPTGWSQGIQASSVPENPTSIQVSLNTIEETWLGARVSTNGQPGFMDLEVHVISNADVSMHKIEKFRLVAAPHILVVDDDCGEDYGNVESYFSNALDQVVTNKVFGVWDVIQNPVTDAMLAERDVVVWFTGNCPNGNTISIEERAMLETYLNNGGALFMTGQYITYELRTSPFFIDYLHVTFDVAFPQGTTVIGSAEDPIFNDLYFNITGGDGASNQIRPAAINPADATAAAAADYSGSIYHAAIRAQNEVNRTLYLGFGFEGIADQASRNAVMGNALAWLDPSMAVDPQPDISVTPKEFALGTCYPNPFNPTTTIPYSLTEHADISLRVFDVLGREVAVLASGPQAAGSYTATWNAAGLASGLYFCRLDAVSGATDRHAVQKMMLMK